MKMKMKMKTKTTKRECEMCEQVRVVNAFGYCKRCAELARKDHPMSLAQLRAAIRDDARY